MNKLDTLFKEKAQNILSIYLTAGYPYRESLPDLIYALEEAGVDMIEVGMPYSDPMADGPTIQHSSSVAIAGGMKLDLLFEQIQNLAAQIKIPLVYMGYFNQIMQYGEKAFFEKCAETGISGLIIPDLPLDAYEQYYKDMISDAGLKMSFLIAPQTPEERIRKIDQASTAFVYVVADAKVTGAKKGISGEQIAYFERIRSLRLKNPTLIGFGIGDKESFDIACSYANGAIIGSAFIRALTDANNKNITDKVKAFFSIFR